MNQSRIAKLANQIGHCIGPYQHLIEQIGGSHISTARVGLICWHPRLKEWLTIFASKYHMRFAAFQ